MSDLKRRLDALFDKKVTKNVEATVRRVALDLLGTIKILTPVDTGRARSNWHLEVGVRDIVLVEPGGDLPADVSNYRIDKTIFISNNLPYIQALEDGHSQQAPKGMVKDAIATVKRRAKARTGFDGGSLRSRASGNV